ncbi:MAG: hypothetical protein AAF625_01025 [Pseudomonadota bacterium]
MSDVSANGTFQVDLIRGGFWLIVTAKEWGPRQVGAWHEGEQRWPVSKTKKENLDVLGHTDMDVTLGYMLSDAEFQADAEKVRQEHKHLLRVRIVNEIDECGGPSAPRIRVARDELRARGIREDLGDDDPELLLAVLPNIQQVGPERYCTAGDMENGLCSKFTGQRDVGACNSSCIFRLEMAASRQDRKEAIRNALQLLSGDVGRGIRVFFQSQIIGNLSVFESTIDEFLDDKRFKAALFDCEKRLFAPLPPSTREKLAQLVG